MSFGPKTARWNSIARMRAASIFLALVWLAFCHAIVWAEAPLSVRLTITDASSVPVSGATVDIQSQGKTISSATTDDHGIVTLTLPSAGKYDATISKPGYLTTQTTIDVVAGNAAQQIDVVLPQSALSKQQIDVTATASNPTTETTATTSKIDVDQAKIAPGNPPTLNDALPLVPGVVRAPDGSVAIAGYGQTHSALLVNSVNVTDPATGGFGLSVPIDSVETISVSEMPYLAEYGKFTAGVVAAETKRGGDKWEYSLNDPFPDFEIRSWQMEGIKDASPRLNVSGPIIPGKLYFMEGGEYLLYKREVYTLPWGQNETKSQAFNSFSQLDWILSPNQTLTASFHIAPQSLDYAGLNYFNPQPVTPDAHFHESTATVIHRLSIGGGLLQSTFANTQVTSEIRPQTFGDMILTPEGNTGTYFSGQDRRANRYQWMESWKPKTLHFHGDHQLQIGSVVAHSENEGRFAAQPVQIQNTQNQLLQSITFSGAGQFEVADTEPAIYAQDHWMPTARLAFDVGVRLEGQTITHTVRAAPRAGFVYNPKLSPNTVIRGGIGIFYDSVPLDIYAFNNYPQQTITSYNAAGEPVGPPVTYLNVMGQTTQYFGWVSRAPVSGNFAPYSLAGNIEIEQRVKEWLTLRFKYLQSTAQDQLTIASQQVGSQGVYILGSNGSAHTRQAEFTSRIGNQKNRQFFFSYVRQYAVGNISDASNYLGNFPFPVIRQDLIAALPSEIPNRFLLWGVYSLPHKFTLTPKFEVRNGFPYQYTDVLQNYVASTGPQPRFPRYFAADMRLSKDFDVDGGKHAVRLSGSVFNLTNHFNPLEVHTNLADPQFGTFFGNYNRKFTVDFDFLY
jgi:Carboxypeptidase regulatory-like domain